METINNEEEDKFSQLTLEYQSSMTLYKEEDEDPDQNLLTEQIHVRIMLTTSEEVTEVGFIELDYFNHHLAINDSMSIGEGGYHKTMRTAEVGNVLMGDDESNDFAEEIEEGWPDLLDGLRNVLVVDSIGIYPEYRSKGYGKKVLRGLIRQWTGRCRFIVLKSYPKQHERDYKIRLEEPNHELTPRQVRMALDLLEKDYKKAQKKLDKFYKSCGFDVLVKEKLENEDKNYFIHCYN